jgi:ubiquinone/menaquinone biosynthesis C-methylase UbiE
MVHCEADILETYLTECARILKPDGWGFIHHSNIGYYRNLLTGKLKCENIHARGETMTAQLFSKYCKKNGLTCVRQEVVNWGGNILNDCFSLFTKKTAIEGSDIKYIENNEFHKEIERIRNIAGFYTMQ